MQELPSVDYAYKGDMIPWEERMRMRLREAKDTQEASGQEHRNLYDPSNPSIQVKMEDLDTIPLEITAPMTFEGTIEGQQVQVLLDSGCTSLVISRQILKRLGLVNRVRQTSRRVKVVFADGAETELNECAELQVQVGSYSRGMEFYVQESGAEVILGGPFIKRINVIDLDGEANCFTFRDKRNGAIHTWTAWEATSPYLVRSESLGAYAGRLRRIATKCLVTEFAYLDMREVAYVREIRIHDITTSQKKETNGNEFPQVEDTGKKRVRWDEPDGKERPQRRFKANEKKRVNERLLERANEAMKGPQRRFKANGKGGVNERLFERANDAMSTPPLT